ncbi:MAG: YbaB/EbfC family nucleoid-associated protein [Chlorobi bacterium]|nr:MAG: Nucleoid-associated protein [Chlorobi bacterium OLB7]MBK8911724.1 YbaB/EbfC family nucleoid-associated protein [Chlorobiota bacterium]MBX7216533.1 YbaB/EbfC family nucleoid-associated protein [Candidatus Kapabacteria bacterium]
MTNQLMQAMQQMQEVQRKMDEAQSKFHELLMTEEAGGGAVRATANGHGELTKLVLDPSLLQPSDKEALEDLIIIAVNRATLAAKEAAAQKLEEATGGFMPDISGLMGQ